MPSASSALRATPHARRLPRSPLCCRPRRQRKARSPMREPRFWQHPRAGRVSVLPSLLAPVAYLWGAAGRIRRRYAKPERAAVPVICIGNLSAGGTGKTPLALPLAERFIKSGEVVHFLTRGYGGRAHGPLRVDPLRDTAPDVGDEPPLLAPVAPTWVSTRQS